MRRLAVPAALSLELDHVDAQDVRVLGLVRPPRVDHGLGVLAAQE